MSRAGLIPVLLLLAVSCSLGGSSPAIQTPPSTESVIGSISLEAPRLAIRRFCQIAANELERPVPCPTLLPASPLFPNTELCTGRDRRLGGPGCFRGGAFLMEEVFEGPGEYAGMPTSDGSISNIGHLNIWSGPIGKIDDAGLGCQGNEQTAGTTEVAGQAAEWIVCPENGIPPQDSGHVVLELHDDRIANAVSLHRDSAVNRRLAVVIAKHLALVSPNESGTSS